MAIKAVHLQISVAAVAFEVDKEVLRTAIDDEHRKNALSGKDYVNNYSPSARNRFQAKLSWRW